MVFEVANPYFEAVQLPTEMVWHVVLDVLGHVVEPVLSVQVYHPVMYRGHPKLDIFKLPSCPSLKVVEVFNERPKFSFKFSSLLVTTFLQALANLFDHFRLLFALLQPFVNL
ncbi:hypothetical protein HG531_006183 [Fusarium graminearum]|nr:hypothetical protein HG531_006183 [Fusarium graminearum]